MRTGGYGFFRESSVGLQRIGRMSVLALALLLVAACGGGGGGGGSSSGAGNSTPQSASFSYPSGTQTFVVGTAITPVAATVTGTLSNFTVSPSLPAGLSLDSAKGTISGTPSAVTAAKQYTVSATGATATATVSIAVNDVSPAQVSYGASGFTFSASIASATLTPTASGGAVTSWSISPALPAGLSFDTAHGGISGTPTAATAAANYVVTAQNSGGQSSVTLKITVDSGSRLHLGHQIFVKSVRVSATNLLSEDDSGNWILWDYGSTAVLASGSSGCDYISRTVACLSSPIEMAGSTAVIVTPTGFELHSATDGHTTGTITTSAWWYKLATDGSYIATGNPSGLSAWSPSGQLLFSRTGDYSHAVAFAAPGNVLVGAGPAGSNTVETITVPAGAATTAAQQFNGQFGSWFPDGSRFTAVAGATGLIYSSAVSQLGSISPLTTGTQVVGQGNWVWTSVGAVLNVYPAAGDSSAPAFTYPMSVGAPAFPSALTVGFVSGSTTFSVVDLSGATPVKTDYSSPLVSVSSDPGATPYTAYSASRWILGNIDGLVIDGTSLASTARYFGFGVVRSIAGGSDHFAVATASGTIFYFSSTTLLLEGRINFPATQLAMSADGSVLVARGASVTVYSLPSGNPLYTWTGAPASDISLSASGTELGQVWSADPITQQVSAVTGGSVIFSDSINNPASQDIADAPPLVLSPDGTFIAAVQTDGIPTQGASFPVTNLYHNGTLVTAFSNGFPAGWLDSNRLLMNNYTSTPEGIYSIVRYAGCGLYGPDGKATGAACGLTKEVTELQPVTSDTIYAAQFNQIVSVSSGAATWMTGDPFFWSSAVHTSDLPPPAALAGAYVVFVSNTDLLTQPF